MRTTTRTMPRDVRVSSPRCSLGRLQRMPMLGLSIAVSISLFLSACAGQSSAQPGPTGSPGDPSPGGATTASAQVLTADPSASGNVRLTLAADGSQASYHAHEQLVSRSLPNEAVGTSSSVSGSIVLYPDGAVAADQSAITFDLRSLKSEESRRDNYIQRNTLQTDQFPTATFVPTALQGLPFPLPTEGTAAFQLSGDLTVHGVTRPVTWQATAQFDGPEVTGSATTSVQLSDFGMSPPKAGPVISVEDALGLQLDFHATRTP